MTAVEEYRKWMESDGHMDLDVMGPADGAVVELEVALVDKQKEIVAALQTAADLEAALTAALLQTSDAHITCRARIAELQTEVEKLTWQRDKVARWNGTDINELDKMWEEQ